jgi:hypothetical protein
LKIFSKKKFYGFIYFYIFSTVLTDFQFIGIFII